MLKSTLARIAALIVLSTPPAVAQSPREIAKRVSPSVVLLVMEDSNGQPLSMGSGFVVREGVVATNMHVIEDAARGYAKLAGQKTKHDIRGIVASDPARDLVLLSVEGIQTEPLAIGDSDQVAVGDEVYAVGNPRGLEGTFSAGIVSSVRKVGEDSLLQITAPISPGSSGGPVVNSKGEIIGVAVATFKGGQNLNFAIPSRYLSALIPLIKVPVALSEANKTAKGKKERSILDHLGGRSTEGVTTARFLWSYDTPQNGGSPFTFSIRNQLREPVRNVICLVVFYGNDGLPLDTTLVTLEDPVLPGLAKRVEGRADQSVHRLLLQDERRAMSEFLNDLVQTEGALPSLQDKRWTRIEFRVLHFDVVNPDESADDVGAGAMPQKIPATGNETVPDTPRGAPSAPQMLVMRVEAELRRLEKLLAEAAAKVAPAGAAPDLIESRIEGEFEGWDGETIFKLDNGQIWQQVSFAFTYHYAFRPKVTIIKTHGAYKMKVDGVSSTIFVKRLK